MGAQSDLFGQGQIRLAELAVYNWGSFHGLHAAQINPEGTLITGTNGTGKSTFIDGLMALLQPAGKASFNVAAAQGDRSDRSLLSYMRGSFGSEHDGVHTRVKSKREKAVLSGLQALYRNDDGSQITLIALFWTLQATNSLSDVKRCYLIAKNYLPLKNVLDAFGEGDVRQFKQWLKNKPEVICCDDRFNEYQDLYRTYLGMENKNAPALLSRALGLKKIDDLTQLIRELVLEPSQIRDEARQIVNEFADLVATHNQLLDVREQVNHLQELPTKAENIEKFTAQFQQLERQKAGLPAYFAEQVAALLTQQMAELTAQLDSLHHQLHQCETEIQDSENLVEQRHADYLKLGGNQIEMLKKELVHIQAHFERIIQVSGLYQQTCRDLNIDEKLSEPVFLQNQKVAEVQLTDSQAQKDVRLAEYAQLAQQQQTLEKARSETETEIQEIAARPNSNIALKYQQLRDRLQQELHFADKALMFIGELIDVKENEQQWQGAIERALGGRRTTLLVPQAHYAQVTDWLNRHHTGLLVRVQVVNDEHQSAVQFSAHGFLSKLVWREHPYQNWLKNHLEKFDLRCVSSVEELNRTPFSLTEQGLIHLQQGYFEKKDQHKISDRSQWQLGFSNQQRLALLKSELHRLEQEIAQSKDLVAKAYQGMAKLQEQIDQWKKLSEFQWEDINAPYWQQKLAKTQQELTALEQNSGDLNQAKMRWEQAKTALQTLQKQQNKLSAEKGSQENNLKNVQTRLAQAEKLMQAGFDETVRPLLAKRVGKVQLDDAMQQSRVETQLDAELDKSREQLIKEKTAAIGLMNLFKGNPKWQPLTVDWHIGFEGLEDYLNYFNQLKEEGLPELFEQFKGRLNKHTTQSLARLQNQLETEYEKIRDRINRINLVLAKTEFKQHSYLRLMAKREKYYHVQEFDKKLKKALSFLTADNHEERFYLLQDIVNILDKASSQSAHTLESLRLLDPRYQMAFYAEEIHNETQAVLDVLDSSSGKSGGEKESFAGVIMAASLAYVLTPDHCDRPVYCSVFLDEAFSNTAESVSRRVLRVFKALHIHVNLITPFKNIDLARESAKSLLIAERDPEKHESRLCEMTWQELDRQQAEKQQQALDKLGIEVI